VNDDERDLGPDERDMDLIDGSWEQRYYEPGRRAVNWNFAALALGLLALMGIVIPMILVVFR
jgi:hypothetical protein